MRISGADVEETLHEAGGGNEPVEMPKEQKAAALGFPLHIYPPHIQTSFAQLAQQYSIPLDYLGVTGLFVIGALAGNMYRGIMLEEIKPIIYACVVGPSGVGKSPAYKHLCDYIIAPLQAQTMHNYKAELKSYKEREAAARFAKEPFTEEPPIKKLRTITDATLEAITMHAVTSPAGFGVVYDEGERFFSGANAYKRDTSSVGFWNEMWNGRGYNIVRVDSEKDRHIDSAAISVIIGMQRERLLKFFNEDTIASGLLNRFLICESDYIFINENNDPFAYGAQVHPYWQELVTRLYHKGVQYVPGTEHKVYFQPEAQQRMREVLRGLTVQSNADIKEAKEGKELQLLIAYASKLHAYVPRLAVILAIMDNTEQPQITVEHVNNALRLHQYFKETARRMLLNISGVAESGLNEKQLQFFQELPLEFTTSDAISISARMGLSRNWFSMQMSRNLFKGFITKTGRGNYEKEV